MKTMKKEKKEMIEVAIFYWNNMFNEYRVYFCFFEKMSKEEAYSKTVKHLKTVNDFVTDDDILSIIHCEISDVGHEIVNRIYQACIDDAGLMDTDNVKYLREYSDKYMPTVRGLNNGSIPIIIPVLSYENGQKIMTIKIK